MRKNIVLLLFAIILISLCSCELSMEKPKQGKVHILVYGNDYRYMPSGHLNDTVNDAVQVGMSQQMLLDAWGEPQQRRRFDVNFKSFTKYVYPFADVVVSSSRYITEITIK